MTKELIPLDEFEKRARAFHDRIDHQGDKPNGISCPRCGHELVDNDPTCTLMSNPPQKSIRCRRCSYSGYRTA